MTRIEEIEAREKAATKGPWRDSEGDVFFNGDFVARCNRLGNDRLDARFIAYAREDIPYLLAELKEAREKYGCLLHNHDDVTLPLLYKAGEKLKAVEGLRDALKKLRPREGTVNYETLRQLDRILQGGD